MREIKAGKWLIGWKNFRGGEGRGRIA